MLIPFYLWPDAAAYADVVSMLNALSVSATASACQHHMTSQCAAAQMLMTAAERSACLYPCTRHRGGALHLLSHRERLMGSDESHPADTPCAKPPKP